MNEQVIKVTSNNNKYTVLLSSNLIEDVRQMYALDLVKYVEDQFNNLFDVLKLDSGTYYLEIKKDFNNTHLAMIVDLKKCEGQVQ